MNIESKKILEKEGWYEGRNIDISFLEKISYEGKFEIFDAAKNFLKEFGGICIHRQDPVTKGPYPYHRFDKTLFFSEIISQTIKEKAICVGTIEGNNFNLYISESGKIYYDDGFIANNIYEAWDHIFETISWDEMRSLEKDWKELGVERDYREACYEYWHAKEVKSKLLVAQNEGLTLDQISEKYDISIPFIVKMLNK